LLIPPVSSEFGPRELRGHLSPRASDVTLLTGDQATKNRPGVSGIPGPLTDARSGKQAGAKLEGYFRH
jgi:hypothetical protein